MLLGMDEDLLRAGLNKLATERHEESKSNQSSIDAANTQIEAIGKKIASLMRTFEEDDDEDVVAGLRLSVNELKKAKADLVIQRDKFAAEVLVSRISPSQIDDIISFSRQIKGKMANGTHDYKKELLRMLKVHVELKRDGDGYQLKMSCDLPGSEHSEKIPLCKRVNTYNFDGLT
jgi:hypothetical protein